MGVQEKWLDTTKMYFQILITYNFVSFFESPMIHI